MPVCEKDSTRYENDGIKYYYGCGKQEGQYVVIDPSIQEADCKNAKYTTKKYTGCIINNTDGSQGEFNASEFSLNTCSKYCKKIKKPQIKNNKPIHLEPFKPSPTT